jgi:hypothetical protein
MRIRRVAGALGGLAALVLFSFDAQAQMDKLKSTTPEERAGAQTAFMKTKLGLSADQVAKVSAINLKYAQKMDPILKGSEGPIMRMREAEAINQQKEAELKQVLSSEQFEKYLASKEEMREKVEQKIEDKLQGKAGGAE